jgi:hypothetical protein
VFREGSRGKSFGKERKGRNNSTEKHLISVPGPGQYTINTTLSKSTTPKYGNYQFLKF